MAIRYLKSLDWIYNNESIIKIESISAYLNEEMSRHILKTENGSIVLIETIISDMCFVDEYNELQLIDNTEYWFTYSSTSDLIVQDLLIAILEKVADNKGILNSKNYVGNLELGIGIFDIVVKSKKVNYDRDFKFLRSNISEFCSDLLSRSHSYYSEYFSKSENYAGDRINYSEVAYLKEMLLPEKLPSWIDYIVYHPEHRFEKKVELRNCTEVDEVDVEYYLKGLVAGNIQKSSRLAGVAGRIGLAPIEVLTNISYITYDTVENRFVKFFIRYLKEFIEQVIEKTDVNNFKLYYELNKMHAIIEERVDYPFWKNVSRMESIPFNSQILQKKFPYNLIFQVYTEFEMKSQINLGDVDKQYAVGQKDAPMLYQYWVFIMIFKHLAKKYKNKYITSDWLSYDGKNLNFTLCEGRKSHAKFSIDCETEVHLFYNKTYGSKHVICTGRSYSHDMKPDISIELFKNNELISIIHFDAKYRAPINGSDVPDDINKMHAYKDGILGTVGAYAVCLAEDKVIYKEIEKDEVTKGMFPSVGACPLNLSPETLSDEIENIMYIIDEFTKIDVENTANRYSKTRLKNYYALARKMMELEE